MNKKEFKKKLVVKLNEMKFVQMNVNHWNLKDGDFYFEVEMQGSQYGKGNFYINMSFTIDGFLVDDSYEYPLYKERVKSSFDRVAHTNPSYKETIVQIKRFINEHNTLEKIKLKFLKNEDFRNRIMGRKIIEYLNPDDKRLLPEVYPDYSKEEELIKNYNTYQIMNNTVYVSRYYYSINEQIWKDFAEKSGYKLAIAGSGKKGKINPNLDYKKDENLFARWISYLQGKDMIYVNSEYYVLDEERWKEFAEKNNCGIKVCKW